MTKLYVLFYDREDGCDRESWSVFYTPCEVFTDPALVKAREAFIVKSNPELACSIREVEISTVADTPVESAYEDDDFEDDEDDR